MHLSNLEWMFYAKIFNTTHLKSRVGSYPKVPPRLIPRLPELLFGSRPSRDDSDDSSPVTGKVTSAKAVEAWHLRLSHGTAGRFSMLSLEKLVTGFPIHGV
jgi:hypothetical protein